VVFDHPVLKDTPVGCFWQRSAPIGGSSWTVNPSGGLLSNVSAHRAVAHASHGASYRQLIDMAALGRSLFVSTMGQGEQPLSPFFDHYFEL
jgi:acyl-homoserine lactone acylase PvdQ